MKKSFILTLAVALALVVTALPFGATTSAQGPCFSDGLSYEVCFVENSNLAVYRVNDMGMGQYMGRVDGDVFRYAAAVLGENEQTLIARVTDDDGFYADVYFSSKSANDDGTYVVVITVVLYTPEGGRVGAGEARETFTPDSTLAVSFPGGAPAPAAPAAPAGDGAAPAVTGGEAYTGGAFEPTVAVPGEVDECLVRTTYTVRIRRAPTTTSEILDTVPYDTTMPSDFLTTDDEWVRTFYVAEGGEGLLGWISTRYVELGESCEGISRAFPADATTAPAAAPAAPAADDDGGDAETPTTGTPTNDPTAGGQLDLTVVEPGDVAECLVRTTYSVRMRAMPNTSSAVLESLPYDFTMPADLRTTDGNWIRAFYLGQLGWVNARYLELGETCGGLNGINPMP